jgi:hypothetical protein
VINSFIVPCNDRVDPECNDYDEYGIYNDCDQMTLSIVCWEDKKKEMKKEFTDYDEAIKFIQEGIEKGVKSFEIKRIQPK